MFAFLYCALLFAPAAIPDRPEGWSFVPARPAPAYLAGAEELRSGKREPNVLLGLPGMLLFGLPYLPNLFAAPFMLFGGLAILALTGDSHLLGAALGSLVPAAGPLLLRASGNPIATPFAFLATGARMDTTRTAYRRAMLVEGVVESAGFALIILSTIFSVPADAPRRAGQLRLTGAGAEVAF